MAHSLSRSTACGIFLDQGSNPCPLHWQADSYPLRHQGSPKAAFLNLFLRTSIPLPAIRRPVYLRKIKVLRHKPTQLLHTSYKFIYSCILPPLVFSISEGKGSFLVPNPSSFAMDPITSSHDHPLPSSKIDPLCDSLW